MREVNTLRGRQGRGHEFTKSAALRAGAEGVLMQSSIGCGCKAGRGIGKVQDARRPDMLAKRGAGKEQGGFWRVGFGFFLECGCVAA